MSTVTVDMTSEVEARVIRREERPITFERYLELSDGRDFELVQGVMVERMAAHLAHEKLFTWLHTLLHLYVQRRGAGIVLGSRTAVKLDPFGGRLPDVVFVSNARLTILQESGIYGAPDLVIELASPNDRPSDEVNLETDYRNLGVPEIVFVNAQKRRVRILRLRGTEYEESTVTAGEVAFETVPGFSVQAEWLFDEPRPDELDTLMALLSRS